MSDTLDTNIYTKKGTLRKRKPKKSRNYFTQETEDAIVEFISCKDIKKREQAQQKILDREQENYLKLTKSFDNLINKLQFPGTKLEHTKANLQLHGSQGIIDYNRRIERQKKGGSIKDLLSPETLEMTKQFGSGDEAKDQIIRESVLKDIAKINVNTDSGLKQLSLFFTGLGQIPAMFMKNEKDIAGFQKFKEATLKKGQLELMSKTMQEGAIDTGGASGADIDTKLKTDYHTPKIININILTGSGAAMIQGGVTTQIETTKVDSQEIRKNIETTLQQQLNNMLNDTSSSLLRVINSNA
jgi:fructose/tagatose bisphosphate aldolase